MNRDSPKEFLCSMDYEHIKFKYIVTYLNFIKYDGIDITHLDAKMYNLLKKCMNSVKVSSAESYKIFHIYDRLIAKGLILHFHYIETFL